MGGSRKGLPCHRSLLTVFMCLIVAPDKSCATQHKPNRLQIKRKTGTVYGLASGLGTAAGSIAEVASWAQVI